MSRKVATYPMNDNAVRNFTFEQFFDIFKTTQLDISSFWLINAGFDDQGLKKYAHLVLRACSIRPLFGPHLVSIFEIPSDSSNEDPIKPEMRTFWVHSLTDLRRNHFQFRDRLSFERSTYLIPYTDGQLLIRLKSIRAFLRLPMAQENSTSIQRIEAHSAESEDVEEDTSLLVHERSSKMKTLLNHHVQTMVSYLNRELQQDNTTSIKMVDSYVTSYCSELLTQLKST